MQIDSTCKQIVHALLRYFPEEKKNELTEKHVEACLAADSDAFVYLYVDGLGIACTCLRPELHVRAKRICMPVSIQLISMYIKVFERLENMSMLAWMLIQVCSRMRICVHGILAVPAFSLHL